MKEKILALLVAKFTGVRKDGLTQMARLYALQAATDDEAKALVDKLTKEQVDDFIREFRGDVDKEVSEGNKTFETNLKKKFDFVEKKGTSNTGDPEPPKDNERTELFQTTKVQIFESNSQRCIQQSKLRRNVTPCRLCIAYIWAYVFHY